MIQIWNEIKGLSKRFFDLDSDRASYNEIIDGIEAGVEIRGTNLWILMFAIIVASVGLNMNSTAVVIGAMLISPLMGPIIGLGLGVGIYDFQLIKKSFRSLAAAVLISVLASAAYFALTPLSDAQSELLSRTTPTIWDVLISFFGGLAGIVAITRKDKSNAIPGVAIATALMPPLCTAGYGIATLNLAYFLGAFYLFFINSVFISISSMLIIRFLKIPSKKWVDKIQQKKMRTYVFIVALLTIVPSVFMAVDIVQRSIFQRNANQYITEEFNYDDTSVIERAIDPKNNKIEVFLFGTPLTDFELKRLNSELKDYNLTDAKLLIRQNQINQTLPDAESMRTGIVEDLYRRNETLIENKAQQIALLENELRKYKNNELIQDEVCKELEVQYPEIKASAINTMYIHKQAAEVDTVMMVYLDTKKPIQGTSLTKLEAWLKLRLKSDRINIVQD
jgi:uncharacterized hydrophobic protein (TIGR00271 family)